MSTSTQSIEKYNIPNTFTHSTATGMQTKRQLMRWTIGWTYFFASRITLNSRQNIWTLLFWFVATIYCFDLFWCSHLSVLQIDLYHFWLVDRLSFCLFVGYPHCSGVWVLKYVHNCFAWNLQGRVVWQEILKDGLHTQSVDATHKYNDSSVSIKEFYNHLGTLFHSSTSVLELFNPHLRWSSRVWVCARPKAAYRLNCLVES